MKILKRIELWILLALISGAIAVVISTSKDDAGGEPGTEKPPSETSPVPDAPFTIDASHLKRDYGNAVLEIHLTYRNDSDSAIELSSPTARLLSGPDPDAPRGAEEVSAFFLAFAPPPAIPAGETAGAVLKFWLEKPHLETALWLRILEDDRPVKTPEPLDLETIPNQETLVFTAPDWK